MAKSTVGPWARDKLDRLGKYLHAYTTIMRKQEWCDGFTYIDAFAGPGEHEIRRRQSSRPSPKELLIDASEFGRSDKDQQEFIAGSPRVALELEHPFTYYVFVEKSPERIRELEELKSEFGASRAIVVRKGDCNKYLLEKIANNPNVDWKSHRAIVFLDPFGMQARWPAIGGLANPRGVEIFLNFPVGMAIQRLLLRNPDDFTAAQRKSLDEYFGSPEWFDVLYKQQADLFGDIRTEKIANSGEALLKWYRKRLRTVFTHVSKAALIRNTRGGHLYYLLIETHNATGRRIANDILSGGEYVS